MADTVNVGILGRGTVGGAFRRLLNERADMVEEVSGRRPRVSGVLSRKQGDFDRILSRSDIVVILSRIGTTGVPPCTAIRPAPDLNGWVGPPTVSLPSG